MTGTFTLVRLDFPLFISTKSPILFYHGLLVVCPKPFSFFSSFSHVKSTQKTFERNTPPSCKCAYQLLLLLLLLLTSYLPRIPTSQKCFSVGSCNSINYIKYLVMHYLHEHIYTHIHIYTYTHIHIYTYTHIHIYTYIQYNFIHITLYIYNIKATASKRNTTHFKIIQKSVQSDWF